MRTFRFLLASVLAATGLAVVVTQAPATAAASVGTFDQCERVALTGTCSGWTGGNLISGYVEDMVVPQRVEIDATSAGTYSFSTAYDDLSGSSHIIDYLATYNVSVPNANACQGYAASICAGTPSTFPIPSDTAARGPVVAGYNNVVSSHELPQAQRQWTMWGGTITGSTISHVNGTGVATVSFTTSGAGTVILMFGAHLSLTGPSSNPRAWPAGASTVNGNAQLAANLGGAKTHNIKVGSATPPPPPAAYVITKTVSPTSGAAGAPVTYTVTVTNTGGLAGSTSFSDNYNDNLTSVSTPAGCTAGSGAMTCTTGSILPGNQQVFSYTANLPSTFSGGAGTDGCAANTYPVRNTATLANNTSATALVCATAAAQFSVAKTATPAAPNPGDTVTYKVTVKNTGNAAGSTSVTDDYDDRLTLSAAAGCTASTVSGNKILTCTTGTLASGAEQVFTYTATMPATFDGGTTCPGGYQVANKASAPGAADANASVCVQAAPAFTVTKKVSDSVATPGQVVTYTLTVKNTGTASGSTTVTDTPAAGITLGTLPSGCSTNPNGSFTCTTGPILAGASADIVYSATMPSSFDGTDGTDGCAANTYAISNTATTGSSTSTKTVCVGAAADFSIKKEADSYTASPGGTIGYTVTVTNTGKASGSTTFVDDYDDRIDPSAPSGCTKATVSGNKVLSCTTGKILAGASKVFTYSATMPSTFGDVSGGQGCLTGTYPVANTATLASGPSAKAVVCVSAAASLAVSKFVDKANAGPGDTVTYTVTVTNSGAAAGSTHVTDDFDDRLTPGPVTSDPTGGSCSVVSGTLSCTTGVIPAGGQQTFTYAAVLPSTYSGATGGGDCAAGKYRVANSVALDNQASDSVDVCVTAAPAFVIEKSVDNETPAPGATLTYKVKVSNTGTASGSTSFVDDYDNRLTPSVPTDCADAAGKLTCSTGEIAANGSRTFTYTATLPSTFTGPGGNGSCAVGTYGFANTATLAGGGSDAVTVCVAAAPSFSIAKEASSTSVAAGATVTYKVTVTNSGAASGSTSFVDDYDDRLTPSVPTDCTDAAGKLTCQTGEILAGQSRTFTYTAAMPDAFASTDPVGTCTTGFYSVPNSATLAGGATAGPSSAVEVCVSAGAAFEVTKAVDDADVEAGDVVTYTITVKNTGTAAGATSFTDDFDDRLSPSDATSTPSGNSCSPSDDNGAKSFSCTTGTIEPGAEQSFSYSVAMPATFDGESGAGDCDPGQYGVDNSVVVGDESASVGVCVSAAPAFTIAKSASSTLVVPGAEVGYTIVVSNTGDASGVTTFTDDYDPSLTVAEAPEGCTVDAQASSFTCTTGTILAGDSQTFTYTGTVPTTFTGAPDGDACEPAAYPVVNTATLGNQVSSGVTVCVDAQADFTIAKTVDDSTVGVGEAVRYTVTVTNNGSATGATSFTDTPDSRYDLTGVSVEGCTLDEDAFTCSTGDLDAGAARDFVFDLTTPLTYAGPSGTGTCAEDTYRVTNTAALDGGADASADVCVAAGPDLRVAKSADATTAVPGQTITYTVTITNPGSVAGSTTFTDDYDDRVTVTAPEGCEAAEGVLTCTSDDVAPAGQQVITYTATLPATFTGPSGQGGCGTGTYPVANAVTLENGQSSSATVCTTAAPKLGLAKAASLDTGSNGDQTITYTLTYANTGNAESLGTVVTDPVPTGTSFVSCSPACTTPGGTATWNVGAVAAGGSGTVTLVVKVTTNQTCVITNTAQVAATGVAGVPSNTVTTNVTPQPDVANAKANGSAVGLSIRTSGLLDLVGPIVGGLFTNNNTLALSRASSSQVGPGGPATSSDSLLSAKIPTNAPLVKAGVLTATSASSVVPAPALARNTTVSEVAGICLVPVGGICTVEADLVRSVATTTATGEYASVSTTGSTITGLKVVNTAVPVDLNQTTTIPLNKAVFGPNSYVAINERTGSAGLQGQKYVADQGVAMIHVKITGVLLGVQAAEIYIAQATSRSEFPKTLLCNGSKNQSVSANAYVARLFTGPVLADLLAGYTQISPLGGAETEHVAEAVIPKYGVIANAKVADSSSTGGFTSTASSSRSWAEVAGDGTKPACVLSYVKDCVVKATVLRSEARSTSNGAGSLSTDTGTSFVGLSVFGVPIAGTPKPNTVLALPGIGFIVLNEQFCDNGSPATSAGCAGSGHTGITVRSVRVVVTVANNLLGLTPGIELVVSEAHAGSTFS